MDKRKRKDINLIKVLMHDYIHQYGEESKDELLKAIDDVSQKPR